MGAKFSVACINKVPRDLSFLLESHHRSRPVCVQENSRQTATNVSPRSFQTIDEARAHKPEGQKLSWLRRRATSFRVFRRPFNCPFPRLSEPFETLRIEGLSNRDPFESRAFRTETLPNGFLPRLLKPSKVLSESPSEAVEGSSASSTLSQAVRSFLRPCRTPFSSNLKPSAAFSKPSVARSKPS